MAAVTKLNTSQATQVTPAEINKIFNNDMIYLSLERMPRANLDKVEF